MIMNNFQKAIVMLVSLAVLWLFIYCRYTIVSGSQAAYRLNRFTGNCTLILGTKEKPVERGY